MPDEEKFRTRPVGEKLRTPLVRRPEAAQVQSKKSGPFLEATPPVAVRIGVLETPPTYILVTFELIFTE
jgi:hypothetical protein